MTKPHHILLQGVVGSTAYNLATEHSDIDRIGIFAYPTRTLHGLREPAESLVETTPDRTLHEARKYCRLALNGNPTVTELLWLTHWDITTPDGLNLIDIRTAFLAAPRVRNAYLGYALQQFRKLHDRADRDGTPTFSSDLSNRTAKHARHLFRLCYQGWHLYATGHLQIEVDHPQRFHDFGDKVAAGDLDAARRMLTHYENLFNRTHSPLPEHPDERAVTAWLLRVREHLYQPEDPCPGTATTPDGPGNSPATTSSTVRSPTKT